MINKVWFWLIMVGLFTAFMIDMCEITFVDKQFSSRLFENADEPVLEKEINTSLEIETDGKTIRTEKFTLPKGANLREIQKIINASSDEINVSLETFEPHEFEEGYINGIKQSVMEQFKGEGKGNYLLLFKVKGVSEGAINSARFIFPVEALELAKRNTMFNNAFEPFGQMSVVTSSMVNYAGIAVNLAIGLIGIMALWLGLMKIAEKAGLISLLAKIMAPIMRIIFPDVPVDHPAMGSMLLNISANILGLGNAATPLGIKAMEELQELNPNKVIATNAMCTLLVVNTAGFAIVPATIIGIRTAQGSSNPFAIILPVMIASGTATIMGVIMAKILQRFSTYEKALKEIQEEEKTEEGSEKK